MEWVHTLLRVLPVHKRWQGEYDDAGGGQACVLSSLLYQILCAISLYTQFLFFHDSICSTQFDSFYNPIFLARLSSEEDSFELERQARLEISALRQVRHENVICLLEGETGD